MANLLEEVEIIEGQDSRLLQITDKSAQTKIGTLSNLDTESKDNLVVALNEVLSSLNGSVEEISQDIADIIEQIGVLDFEPAVDVTNHGLVGDGVTDNYTAFNTLYSQHKNLYFPEGTYYFSQPITLDQRGSKLKGSGFNTTLKFNTDGILITNFYCEVQNFVMRTNGQNVYGIKLLSSFAKIHDIYMYDSATTWFNNFVLGTDGQGVWFSFIENIIINDSNNHSNNGTVMEFTSTVNNIFTNIVATQKNIGLKFNDNNDAGYSTDGAQINDFNITQCNYGIQIDDCSAIYVSHSIFDQINIKALEITSGRNLVFDECYLSAGSNAVSTYKIADIITSDDIKINNTKMSGAGQSAYGVVIKSSNEVTITNCSIGHTTNGIVFSDTNSTNCLMYNIKFNDLVTAKLYIQGYTNSYGLLKGSGSITVAGALQCATIFNQGTFNISDLGTATYYDCDIPLAGNMAKPIGIFVIPYNGDASFTTSYLANLSPTGYARVRVKKANNDAFNHENLTLSYIYATA